jgi:hypothetical protein
MPDSNAGTAGKPTEIFMARVQQIPRLPWKRPFKPHYQGNATQMLKPTTGRHVDINSD